MRRRISRRAAVASGLAVLATGGISAVIAVLTRGDGDGPQPPETIARPAGTQPPETTTATLEPATANPSPGTATPAPALNVRSVPAEDILHEVFPDGGAITWPAGVFFIRHDHSVEGYSLPSTTSQAVNHQSLGRGDFVLASRYSLGDSVSILRDRAGTFAIAWNADEYRVAAAGRGVLILTVPDTATNAGAIFVVNLDGTLRHQLPLSHASWWAEISPDGRTAVLPVRTASGETSSALIDLSTGKITNLADSTSLFTETADRLGFRLTLGQGSGERRIRTFRWDGTLVSEHRVEVDETTTSQGLVFVHEDYDLAVREVSLHPVMAIGLGGPREWTAVEVVDLKTQQPIYRVRSAALSGFDYLPPRRWLRGFEAFTARVLLRPDEGPVEGMGFGAIYNGRKLRRFLPMEPGTAVIRAISPSPEDADVFAGYRGILHLSSGAWTLIAAPEGTAHIDPFSARPGEAVFVTPHGGHDGPGIPPLLPPRVEVPPYDNTMRFVVARTGDCLNIRARPSTQSESLACVPDGTPLELDADSSSGPNEDPSTRADEQDWRVLWAFVRAGEVRGWVSLQYLEWAMGEPLPVA